MIGDVHAEGVRDVKAALASFDQKTQTLAMRRGLHDAGVVVQAAITEAAPVRMPMKSGTALPPGALKSDITLRVTKSSSGMMAVIQPGPLTRHAARWVEYGHRLVRGGYSRVLRNGRTRGPGSVVGEVPAHPFIRPGFESSVGEAVRAFINGLTGRLKGRS